MDFQCEQCKQTTQAFRATCRHCGTELPPLLQGGALVRKSQRAAMPTPKERVRNARRRGTHAQQSRSSQRRDVSTATRPNRPLIAHGVATARLERTAQGWDLVPLTGKPLGVQVTGDLPADVLAGHLLKYEVQVVGGQRQARPVDCPALEQLRRAFAAAEAAVPGAPGHVVLHGPRPPGATILESLTDRMDQFDRIDKLRRMGWSKSWSELANATRVKAIQKPVFEALASIGWEKIDTLVKSTGRDGWPPELFAWIHKERERASRPRSKDAIRRAMRDGEYGFNPGD